MSERKGIICGLPAFGITPKLQHQPQEEASEDEDCEVEEITERKFLRACGYLIREEVPEEDIEPMSERKGIICGLPAFGITPKLQHQPQEEASEDEDCEVEEITERQFRRACGYLIREEVPEEDIEPMFLRAIRNMKASARNSVPMKRPKQEQGQSSRGKAPRRD